MTTTKSIIIGVSVVTTISIITMVLIVMMSLVITGVSVCCLSNDPWIGVSSLNELYSSSSIITMETLGFTILNNCKHTLLHTTREIY